MVTAAVPLAPLELLTPLVLRDKVPLVTESATVSVLLPASMSVAEIVLPAVKLKIDPRGTLVVAGPVMPGTTLVRLIVVVSVLLLDVPSLAVADSVVDEPEFGAV